MKLSASYPLSPRRALGSTWATSVSAWVMSWVWPPVRLSASGLPSASTITWIFVVRPPRERPMAWSQPPFYGRRRCAGAP